MYTHTRASAYTHTPSKTPTIIHELARHKHEPDRKGGGGKSRTMYSTDISPPRHQTVHNCCRRASSSAEVCVCACRSAAAVRSVCRRRRLREGLSTNRAPRLRQQTYFRPDKANTHTRTLVSSARNSCSACSISAAYTERRLRLHTVGHCSPTSDDTSANARAKLTCLCVCARVHVRWRVCVRRASTVQL